MKYGVLGFVTGCYPFFACFATMLFGIKIISGIFKDRPIVIVFNSRIIFIHVVVMVLLLLLHTHLQFRWVFLGFEDSKVLEILRNIVDGALWTVVASIFRRIAKQV